MRVYTTEKGRRRAKVLIEKGYAWARERWHFSDDVLDELRVVCDPIFGAETLRGDEVGEDEERKNIFRKLATVGYVTIQE